MNITPRLRFEFRERNFGVAALKHQEMQHVLNVLNESPSPRTMNICTYKLSMLFSFAIFQFRLFRRDSFVRKQIITSYNNLIYIYSVIIHAC